MAIPQSEYINVQTKVINISSSSRDFSSLVFTDKGMKEFVPAGYASLKTNYDAGKAVVVPRDAITALFDDSGLVQFLSACFGYAKGTKTVNYIYLAKIQPDETLLATYNAVVTEFQNFGAFTYYTQSLTTDDIYAVAQANEGTEYGWVFAMPTKKANWSADAAGAANCMMTHLTDNVPAFLSWYAAVDYSVAESASTIDYKQFAGAEPTVSTIGDKQSADALKINYIGKVQDFGRNLSFYQRGVNMDGTDAGVVRDACWLNAEIVSAYFALQASVSKIPANYIGSAMVSNIIIGVAARAITNGVILVDKPLSNEAKETIVMYTGDADAPESVETNGYYLDAKIDGDKLTYTLVYAKGDHIQKVSGIHVLA